MAIQVLQQPAEISFAGNPIIVKAKTTLTGKTFLRVKLNCLVKAYRESEEISYSEDYSYEVASDGIAKFNISSTIQTALERCIEQDSDGNTITQKMYAAKFQLTYKEIYLEDVVEVEEGQTTSEEYKAILGRLTEYESLNMSGIDASSILGAGRILSRKPAGEMIPLGEDIYLPVVDTVSDTVGYHLRQGESQSDYTVFTGGILVPKSIVIPTKGLSIGQVTAGASFEEGKPKYITKPRQDMRHFVFTNSFGLLENITAITKEALEYSIDSNLYVIPREVGYRTNTQVMNFMSTPFATLKMTSGYVSHEWAEWYLNEFLTTRHVWMKLGSRYVPVSIIPEEKNELYDSSKPGLAAISFTVRYSFNGGTLNSFVR